MDPIIDTESGPIRCDSSLSVVKIQPVNDSQKGKRLLARHKFSDPEIEELYQLHSANQKFTELFRCFLYCILFYSIVHILIYGSWIGRNPVLFGGSESHERYHQHESSEDHGLSTTTDFEAETPETMTLNTYASMLETNSRLLKSVFHVDETSDILQYSVVRKHKKINQYPVGGISTTTTTKTVNMGKALMSLETDNHLAEAETAQVKLKNQQQQKQQEGGRSTLRVMMSHPPPPPPPIPLPAPPPKPSNNSHESVNINNNKDSEVNRYNNNDSSSSSNSNGYGDGGGGIPNITSATSSTEGGWRANTFHLPPPSSPSQRKTLQKLSLHSHHTSSSAAAAAGKEHLIQKKNQLNKKPSTAAENQLKLKGEGIIIAHKKAVVKLGDNIIDGDVANESDNEGDAAAENNDDDDEDYNKIEDSGGGVKMTSKSTTMKSSKKVAAAPPLQKFVSSASFEDGAASGKFQYDSIFRSKKAWWYPYAASAAAVKPSFHFRGKRNIITRGVHRYNSEKQASNNNNSNKKGDHQNANNNEHHPHKLDPISNSISSSSSNKLSSVSTKSVVAAAAGESREEEEEKLPNFKAYAYTRMGSEFDSHTEPNPGNLYFVLVLLCLLVACVFIVSFMLLPFKRCPRNHHIPVIIWSATILCSLACNVESSVHPRLAFGWILLETFLIWITLPLRMRTALVYTTTIAMLYVVVTSIRERNRPYLGRQVGADIILIVITNILGMLQFYLSDKKQRRAFIDTRQSLEMKLVIEEQAKEQERLLLSVLPEHLALKMRQDLGEAVDGQFKKIYMSRHENVSILYADIVGFTAISSTYSASELVKILNELFATFDKLADKYNQIRIKILGDCYYCICGAPEEREDHAILCVHMGLSMVKAIKYVREKTKSSVDMRVGIHTGAILAGVMGQRQWQFDIYSKDVELANKMESSGKPGRVHISEVTLSFLNDGFEVEPAHGEKREEILRIAGIKTYFIVRPIKPLRESCTGATENGDVPPDDTIITKDLPSDLHSTFAEDSNSAIDESHVHGKQTELEAYRLRLKEELLSRDGYKDLSRQSQWLTLSFKDSSKESEFTKHKDPYAGIYYGACPIALVAVALSAFSVVSFTFGGLVVLLVGLLFLTIITTFSACETSPMKSRLKKMSSVIESFCSLESELWMRRLVSVLGALILTAANVAFMIPCFEIKECSTHITEIEEPMVLPNLASKMPGQHDDCRLPTFFIPFATVILFSITLLTYLGFWLKSLIITSILLLHTLLMLTTPLKAEMECSERLLDNDEFRLIPVYCYLALFSVVAFAGLFSLNRRLEKSARVLFLWKTEVEHQRETATQLRQKNESLVYNILPPHVATHFLGSRRRRHEELYSQSYSEVGILFASMPNFSDFYTEETVNNQGLECLRFLNEVISDYDALLELPKFNEHIIKIKTISSTYMAASGLSPSKQAKMEDPVKTRWQHLSLLVEFAFELKRALTSINEQSFNHFVLKMGINHGPITAGVIGARKPHYDIWGNSVNVASRMESTGKAGCIQVTADCNRILRLYGYQFEQRGLVNVKGKGQLMTYYLIGRGPEPSDQEVQKMLSEPETDGNTVTQ